MLTVAKLFHSTPLHRQRGASSTEFTIAAIIILLTALSIYEVTRAQALKQIFHQALLESARTAAVQHVNPSHMEQRLDEAMLPWWTRKTTLSALKAQQQSQRLFKEKYQLHPWQITIHSPNTQSFQRYADSRARLAVATPYLTINNHYQYEHHHGLLKTDGTSTFSNSLALLNEHSVLDANTIQLEGIYLYEPSALPVRAVIAIASRFSQAESYSQKALQKGLIPLQITLAVGAQSHPVQWPIKANQPIQRAQSSNAVPMASSYGRF